MLLSTARLFFFKMEHFDEAPGREAESKTQGDTADRLQTRRIASKSGGDGGEANAGRDDEEL